MQYTIFKLQHFELLIFDFVVLSVNFLEEDPTSNNSESIAAFSSNASGLIGDNDVSDSSQPKEPPEHKVNRYW